MRCASARSFHRVDMRAAPAVAEGKVPRWRTIKDQAKRAASRMEVSGGVSVGRREDLEEGDLPGTASLERFMAGLVGREGGKGRVSKEKKKNEMIL